MKSRTLYNFIRDAVVSVPEVKEHLSNKARYALAVRGTYKTAQYFLDQIEGLVTSLYNNMIGGDFIDVMANVISGQIYDAYSTAWTDEGGLGAMPGYLEAAYQEMVSNQYAYVDQYFRDIIDARIDGTSLSPLLARAQLWAGQWDTAYQNAVTMITKEGGGNMVWVEGDTVDKCPTCLALDGFVMRAAEWDALGLAPKNAPNDKIDCGGWRCECQLLPTDKRRSPGAYGRIEEILLAR